MGKVDIENATYWAKWYVKHCLAERDSYESESIHEYKIYEAINMVDRHIDLDATPAIYGFMAATNLPDRNQVFVSCNKRDMQPYRCDTALARDLAEAWEIAFNHARSFGETSVQINGLIFQLSPFFMVVRHES